MLITSSTSHPHTDSTHLQGGNSPYSKRKVEARRVALLFFLGQCCRREHVLLLGMNRVCQGLHHCHLAKHTPYFDLLICTGGLLQLLIQLLRCHTHEGLISLKGFSHKCRLPCSSQAAVNVAAVPVTTSITFFGPCSVQTEDDNLVKRPCQLDVLRCLAAVCTRSTKLKALSA